MKVADTACHITWQTLPKKIEDKMRTFTRYLFQGIRRQIKCYKKDYKDLKVKNHEHFRDQIVLHRLHVEVQDFTQG